MMTQALKDLVRLVSERLAGLGSGAENTYAGQCLTEAVTVFERAIRDLEDDRHVDRSRVYASITRGLILAHEGGAFEQQKRNVEDHLGRGGGQSTPKGEAPES